MLSQRYYRTEAPSELPVSLAEMKAHLRLDHADEDELIAAKIAAAVERFEGAGGRPGGLLGRALMAQTWVLETPGPNACGVIEVRYGELQQVTGIEVLAQGAHGAWPQEEWRVGHGEFWPFIAPVAGAAFPPHDTREDAFRITFTVGYATPADVPQALRDALMKLAAHYYATREAVVMTGARGAPVELPFGLVDELSPFAIVPV